MLVCFKIQNCKMFKGGTAKFCLLSSQSFTFPIKCKNYSIVSIKQNSHKCARLPASSPAKSIPCNEQRVKSYMFPELSRWDCDSPIYLHQSDKTDTARQNDWHNVCNVMEALCVITRNETAERNGWSRGRGNRHKELSKKDVAMYMRICPACI